MKEKGARHELHDDVRDWLGGLADGIADDQAVSIS